MKGEIILYFVLGSFLVFGFLPPFMWFWKALEWAIVALG